MFPFSASKSHSSDALRFKRQAGLIGSGSVGGSATKTSLFKKGRHKTGDGWGGISLIAAKLTEQKLLSPVLILFLVLRLQF